MPIYLNLGFLLFVLPLVHRPSISEKWSSCSLQPMCIFDQGMSVLSFLFRVFMEWICIIDLGSIALLCRCVLLSLLGENSCKLGSWKVSSLRVYPCQLGFGQLGICLCILWIPGTMENTRRRAVVVGLVKDMLYFLNLAKYSLSWFPHCLLVTIPCVSSWQSQKLLKYSFHWIWNQPQE